MNGKTHSELDAISPSMAIVGLSCRTYAMAAPIPLLRSFSSSAVPLARGSTEAMAAMLATNDAALM